MEAALLDGRACRLDAGVRGRDEADQSLAEAEPRRRVQAAVAETAECET